MPEIVPEKPDSLNGFHCLMPSNVLTSGAGVNQQIAFWEGCTKSSCSLCSTKKKLIRNWGNVVILHATV